MSDRVERLGKVESEDVNKVVVRTVMATMAAVVDPVGRNANWSQKLSVWYGLISAGQINSRTTIRSSDRDKTGVIIEIGRSLGCVGAAIFGIGFMTAVFHSHSRLHTT